MHWYGLREVVAIATTTRSMTANKRQFRLWLMGQAGVSWGQIAPLKTIFGLKATQKLVHF